MDPDTFRGDVGVEGPDVYWRRRVSVLTGALVVVAVVAWACTSASGGSERGPAGRPVTAGSKEPSPSPSVTAAVTPSPTPTAKTMGSGHATTPRTPSPSPHRPRRPGDRCDNDDLVISLRGQAEVYSGKRSPRFLLTVVNTGRVDCTVDVGPRAVEIRITSGTDRVWSTADCVSGVGADLRRLERGVPHVRMVDWDRHRSAPDCRSSRPKAREGTYVAMARLGELRSPKVVFHLH
ncbi:hypothetical protein [Sphaerisporangium perillae]|uniref:hypothetical protein n=1 Tax=Sphaerisporangium perillae TaxID=2935860 RepID=UPI00200D009A|nr:hypothetical protein [Sphaerisporangium perillae]